MPSPSSSALSGPAAGKTPAAAPGNRLILTATEKGGVGKSTLVTLLAGWFQTQYPSIPLRLFDPDLTNRSLTVRVPAAIELDMSHDEGGDKLMRSFNEGSRVVITDGVGALQQAMFIPYLRSIDLFRLMPELDLGLTFLLIVDDDMELIEQAGVLNKVTADDPVDFLIVRTERNRKDALKWDASAPRAALLKRGAREMYLPQIPDVVRTTIWQNRLSLQAGAAKEDLQLWERARVSRIVKSTYEGFIANKDILVPGESKP